MLDAILNRARNGRAILFCGAGFSADCINFIKQEKRFEELGTGDHLRWLFNNTLSDMGRESGYKDLKNAAEAAREALGSYGLMKLLQEKFRVNMVGGDLVDILRYPWEKIYTTNYDNAIELGLNRAKIMARPVNNLDPIDFLAKNSVDVVHLHGFVDSWNINNFDRSCILDAESYHRTSKLKKLLDIFRQDLDRAEIIVYVGFNASDFHLNHVLINVEGLKEKSFFVNRNTSDPDIDIKRTQSRFGAPLYIGRQGLAVKINGILETDAPSEPVLSSFIRYERPSAASEVPTTKSIEDLFIFGEIAEPQIARDLDHGFSSYHVHRKAVDDIMSLIEGGCKILLLGGDICDGKSIIMMDVIRLIDVSRPVFIMRHPYDDLLDEVANILFAYPNAFVSIENCFDLRKERLISLARQFDASGGALLLTSRTIGIEANSSELLGLAQFMSFRQVRIGKLSDDESDSLSSLIDQIAGWSEFYGRSIADRSIFIRETCRASFPSVLLRLLKSEYVRNRYREEFNKIGEIDISELRAIVGALYISHIGITITSTFLTNIYGIDAKFLIHKMSGKHIDMRLLRMRGNYIETVPSIGATNILKEIIPDNVVIESVVYAIQSICDGSQRDDLTSHILTQMMRFSIIQPVLNEISAVTKFFDTASQIERVRRYVLFWLQWSIALREQDRFTEAEKKLDQADREADMHDKSTGRPYDRSHLLDSRAKLIIAMALRTNINGEHVFRSIKSSSNILIKLLNISSPTHHPYQTLKSLIDLFLTKGHLIPQDLLLASQNSILGVLRISETKLNDIPEGYRSSIAKEALLYAKEHFSPKLIH